MGTYALQNIMGLHRQSAAHRGRALREMHRRALAEVRFTDLAPALELAAEAHEHVVELERARAAAGGGGSTEAVRLEQQRGRAWSRLEGMLDVMARIYADDDPRHTAAVRLRAWLFPGGVLGMADPAAEVRLLGLRDDDHGWGLEIRLLTLEGLADQLLALEARVAEAYGASAEDAPAPALRNADDEAWRLLHVAVAGILGRFPGTEDLGDRRTLLEPLLEPAPVEVERLAEAEF